ncbi:MAG: hypothetical protein H8D96_14375 [Desulfobacterales bacterium]|uniref:Uncharacterized protein n=1 Tax=Candidatus Desulfatibia vada TaxID=2841696 RepID=A0A8J6P5T4_9BACT|nr:hypothetical protein [Candidatus Desulfatibia vada]
MTSYTVDLLIGSQLDFFDWTQFTRVFVWIVTSESFFRVFSDFFGIVYLLQEISPMGWEFE